MKSIFSAILLVSTFVSSASFAGSYNDDYSDITFTSWCEENKVVTRDTYGQSVVIADCNTGGLVCIQKARYTHHNAVVAVGLCSKN